MHARIVKVTLPKADAAGNAWVGSINDMLFDGKPFPWATMGPIRIEFDRHDVARMTITLPFTMAKPTLTETD